MRLKPMYAAWAGALATCLTANTWAAGPHGGGHAAGEASLLPQCQGAAALPSPHCGRTPTAAFDQEGRLWVAFSQNGHVYVTRSADLGKTFAPPATVNRTPEAIRDDGENRPKLVFGDRGELFVSWTMKTPGKYSGDIRFARAEAFDRPFDAPLTINDDRAPISHRFDQLVKDHQGRLYLIWLDKRDLEKAKRSGSAYNGAAVYFAVSTDGGRSFSADRKLADHSCECCRIAADVDRDNRVVVLWRHIYPVNIRDHAIATITPSSAAIDGLPKRATDDGWKIEGCPHHGPDLSIGPTRNGSRKAHLAWFTQGTKNRGLMYGRYDLDSDRLEFQQSIDASAGASRPQVLAGPGGVWRAWKSFDGQRTRLQVSFSSDDGQHWSPAAAVADTETDSDHPDLLAHGNRTFLSWHTQAEGYRLIHLPDQTGARGHVD